MGAQQVAHKLFEPALGGILPFNAIITARFLPGVMDGQMCGCVLHGDPPFVYSYFAVAHVMSGTAALCGIVDVFYVGKIFVMFFPIVHLKKSRTV